MSGPEVPQISQKMSGWAVAAAVLINLIPVAGVLLWGWSAFALIFLYWLENVVIGARTLAQMLSTAANGMISAFGALAIGAFFTVHYGLFCFVHVGFVVTLFGDGSGGDSLFDLASVARKLLANEPNMLAGFASIVLWQAVIFVLYVLRRAWRNANPMELMFAPYPRIVILHLTIIFGGFVLLLLNQPVAGLVVMALVKMGFDVAEALGKGPLFKLGARESEAAS